MQDNFSISQILINLSSEHEHISLLSLDIQIE
jgi:hypothetical protein